MHGHTLCGDTGFCAFACDDGYVQNAANNGCDPMGEGAGGATSGGAGGTSPVEAGGASSGGGSGSSGGSGGFSSGGAGGSSSPCDPLRCPICNRGFEGCCTIANVPKIGTPAHCGCYYFPFVCADAIGG